MEQQMADSKAHPANPVIKSHVKCLLLPTTSSYHGQDYKHVKIMNLVTTNYRELQVVWSFSFGFWPFLFALAAGGHGFECCVFVVGWRHVFRDHRVAFYDKFEYAC